MYSVKTHYWPQGDDDKNLVSEAAHRKRQSEEIKVQFETYCAYKKLSLMAL